MLTKMQNFFPMLWKQIQSRKLPWAPLLSAAEQTRLTWAKTIESQNNIPPIYRVFFESLSLSGQSFPYTVLTPLRDGFFHKTTEKLVVLTGSEINVLENLGDKFKLHCYPFEKIGCIESGVILLDAYVKISGVTREGTPNLIIIQFNSVTDYLFTPILKTMRLAATGHKEILNGNEKDKFDHLSTSNFKFMNYARRSLLTGEKVIQFILQPEIQVPIIKILGRTYHKTLSPTHMSILTDRELIIIREDDPKTRAIGKHGGIWDYIPLNKIRDINLTGRENELVTLSIHLPENTRLEFLFHSSAKPTARSFR